MNLDPTRRQARLEKKIAALRKREFLPASLIDLVAQTAAMQIEAAASLDIAFPAPDALAPLERVVRGVPMLDREHFPIDANATRALFDKLLAMVAAPDCELAPSGLIVGNALESGELDLDAAVAGHLAGDDAYAMEFGEKTPAAPRLLNYLVQASLGPSLEAVGAKVYESYPKERAWEFGHCPVCGSPPLIARLKDKEGRRFLTCSFCCLEYRAKRISCPYCGEEDFKKLEYFTAEEEPGYQVHVCKTCNKYVKTVDFRNFDRPSVPMLDDLESLALDMAAQKRGYTRPVLSAWGF